MQVRLAQSLSISKFPVNRGNNKTCIANLLFFLFLLSATHHVTSIIVDRRICAMYQSTM